MLFQLAGFIIGLAMLGSVFPAVNFISFSLSES
jgi:hypothetical protein